MEVTDDCAVPEEQVLHACCCMLAVVETEWKDGPPQDVTTFYLLRPKNRAHNQSRKPPMQAELLNCPRD